MIGVRIMVGTTVRRLPIGRALFVTILVLPVSVGIVTLVNTFFSSILVGPELWIADLLRDRLMIPPRVSELLSILLLDTGILFILLEVFAGVAAIVVGFRGVQKRTIPKKARQANSRRASKKPKASSLPKRKPIEQGRKAK
jgi:hypothetical protein